ncbi:MAG: hypothetical protein V4530_01795 [Pseudomonadota bacterium]
MEPPHLVERALELAAGGSCKTVGDIRRTLRRERYDLIDQFFDGRAFKQQLAVVIKSARENLRSSPEISWATSFEGVADVIFLKVELSSQHPIPYRLWA